MVGEVHRYDYRTNLHTTSLWMTLLKTVLNMGQLVVVVSAAARFTSLSASTSLASPRPPSVHWYVRSLTLHTQLNLFYHFIFLSHVLLFEA